MAPPKIGLEAVLEDKNFRKGLKNYIDGIEKMEKGNEEMSEAAKKSGKSLDGLSDDMKKGGKSALDLAAQMVVVKMAMNTIKELAGKGLELAKLGATAERVEERFAAFSEEFGGATVMLEAFQKGAGGAASEMDAMLASSKLLQMGLVTSAEEMETTVELATRLGDQTASVTSRVEDFALMLANQSIPRLDNFGISSGKVRARITELMGSVEGMTRETAFMQATMEAGGESLAILGERTKDTAMTFEIMEARMADAKVEMGKKFAPVAGAVFEVLGGLGDEVLMVGAAFGEFGGALVQAGPLLNAMMPALKGLLPAIGKLPSAFKAMNLGLNASTLAMGGLIAATLILVKVTGDLIETNKQVDKEAKESVKVAKDWETAIAAQISTGKEAADVFAEYGQKAQTVSDAWNENIVTSTILGQAFGAHNKILKVIDQTQKEVIASAVTWGGTYEEAVKKIDIYNSQLTDSSFLISGFTEEVYNNVLAFREWVGPAEAVNTLVWDLGEAMIYGELAAFGFEGASYGLTQEMQDQADAVEAAENSLYRYETANERAKRQVREANDEIARRKQVAEEAAAAEVQAAEDAIAAEEKQRAKLIELEDAHNRAKEAAFNHAAGLLTLAERLSNAEDKEALLRASLAKLGELKDAGKLTDEEYLRGYAQLQSQFGFTTKEGVFLKDGIEELGAALGEDKIKISDYGDLVFRLGDMGEKANPKLGAFKDVIGEYETPAEAAARRTEEMTLAIENQETPIGRGFAAMDRLKNVYTDTEKPVLDSTEAVDDFTGKATDADQPTKDLTDKIDLLNKATGESIDPMGDATEAVDDFAEATLNAQEPVDELLARFELLPDQILTLAPKMRNAGEALVGAFRVGFEGAFDALEEEKVKRLRIFREEFHASREPKDPDSPLRGFFEAGAALVQTYMEGLESEWPNLGKTLNDMFTFGRTFGGLGGIAAGILNKDVRAMQQATKGIDAELKAIFKRMGLRGATGGGEETYQAIIAALGGPLRLMELAQRRAQGGALTEAEESALRMWNRLMPLMHERHELTQEQIRLQEKLARMEEQQTRLRFLEQQVALLKMIEKHGLDAGDILDGLQLGADASAEAVLDAMTRAMEEVVRQAEERLGIDSPSKVFFRIGQETMAGMAMGIQDLATLPVRQSVIASRAVASAPARYAGRDYNVTNSRRVTVNSGGNTFNTGMDEASFSSRTTRDVSRAMRGI